MGDRQFIASSVSSLTDFLKTGLSCKTTIYCQFNPGALDCVTNRDLNRREIISVSFHNGVRFYPPYHFGNNPDEVMHPAQTQPGGGRVRVYTVGELQRELNRLPAETPINQALSTGADLVMFSDGSLEIVAPLADSGTPLFFVA